MPTKQTAISIQNCSKTYPDGTIGLRSTQLEISPGEILALLGPSGCGKTTLLRMIAGLEIPNPGTRIYFGPDEVTNLPPEKRQIGMVFQHYALFPHMDLAANITYGLRIRGISHAAIQARLAELLELVRLTGLEHKRPSEISGGQRQRVALARAIAIRPRVLLLDEPLTALDAKLKESLRDELAELLRRLNITAIHVTHDQQEAMAIADRLAVMNQGEVVQLGTAEELYRSPANPLVASFLGQMNSVRLIKNPDGRRGIRLGGAWLDIAADAGSGREVLIRPEDIDLYAVDGDLTERGLGRVVHRTFLGDRIQLRVITPEGIELKVQRARDCPLRVDDPVQIEVNPTALKTFGGE